MNLVDFKKITVKTMPIVFEGVYDRTNEVFVSVKHSLWSTENISVNDYIKQVSELWTVDYLSGQGIEIGLSNISTTLPADKVTVKNYTRGDKVLNFTYDVNNNRLIDITVEGVDSKVDSMSFSEFALIE